MPDKHINFFEFNNTIFSMIREISHKIDLLLQDTANSLDLTPLQLKIIIALYSADEDVSIGNLGRAIGVTGGNISNICKKLEKKGFVDRIRSEEDERVVNVRLTETGIAASKELGEYFYKIREEFPDDAVDVNLETIVEELRELDILLDKYISRRSI
ncbi:MarR family transcriptional regulator [Anaerococcus murdochii]|uniref:MarR family transcriptional regulator n=1 Tax=Anaerococcus degeneri TaxID=361500 RepID=A0ABS7YX07_9FIRM|nr:MarR family transcriptional regulator [Anaerococcus degeneri]MBP2015378.1 DNA-binding MarR family transcriptional regulator [Anaerococcus degeneri]MCA2096272.1 MarR family transcriptional regulator [Anaerococcus degeneri]